MNDIKEISIPFHVIVELSQLLLSLKKVNPNGKFLFFFKKNHLLKIRIKMIKK